MIGFARAGRAPPKKQGAPYRPRRDSRLGSSRSRAHRSQGGDGASSRGETGGHASVGRWRDGATSRREPTMASHTDGAPVDKGIEPAVLPAPEAAGGGARAQPSPRD